MANKSASIVDGVRAAQNQCTSVLERIGKLEVERFRIRRAPRDIDERIASFNEKIDSAAARYWKESAIENSLISPVAIPSGPQQVVNFEAIVTFHAAFFGDQIKSTYAKRLRDSATGEEITSKEAAAKLSECDQQIRSLWNEFERVACEIEVAGMSVERPANEPPVVYLEWDGQNYNEKKLRRLEQRSEDQWAAAQKYQRDRIELQDEIQRRQYDIDNIRSESAISLEGNIRLNKAEWQDVPTKGHYLQKASERLAQSERKLQILSDRYRQESSKSQAERRLLSACKEFLESKRIDVHSTDRLLRETA